MTDFAALEDDGMTNLGALNLRGVWLVRIFQSQ